MRLFLFTAIAGLLSACAQQAPVPVEPADSALVTEYLTPVRVVCSRGDIGNADHLLEPFPGQVYNVEPEGALFSKGDYVVLDFGKEIQGGLQLVRDSKGSKNVRFRIVFGESVSEALSSVGAPGSTATNDHAVRDFELAVPWMGSIEVGNSGFRFVRVELADDGGKDVSLQAVRAVSKYRDVPYLGSFRCSDERLNQIWQTGAYTVHLCMQEYLWDGIKRDRLVWMGDMHPEIMTLNSVFGNQAVVRKSLDFVRDKTEPTEWMNGICSYSLWWIIMQHHLYRWYGDKAYLQEQGAYLMALLHTVMESVDGSRENYGGRRFIDWPSNDQPDVIHAGLQALTIRALEAGAEMAECLGYDYLQKECSVVAQQMRTYIPDAVDNSQAAALLSIVGLMDPEAASDIILKNGPEKFTSFMGYYLLEALAQSGHYAQAMDLISAYWGRMLDLGATTFWEDFNYKDGENAARIDEVVPEGKFDIHADGGAWCYVGLRHSFCHGWASGPTAWLSEHVLGIRPEGIGFRQVRIEPHLGNLDWAEGTFPTPYGVISVRHVRQGDGSVKSSVQLPRNVEVIR